MVDLIELADLAQALRVERGELISLVGGGGKTTTLFTLGRQLAGTTVITTTTKMGSEQSDEFPVLVDPTDEDLSLAIAQTPGVLAWKATDGRRALGVTAATCNRWFDLADNVVVEADGSRKRPFKAPADYEPVVPDRTTLLIACIGVSALGLPIDQGCHRPERVARLAGCSVTDELTAERAAAVLLSQDGSQKHRPLSSRFVVALHRVTSESHHHARALALAIAGRAELVAVAERSDRGNPTPDLGRDPLRG